jgi:hypothetical protein
MQRNGCRRSAGAFGRGIGAWVSIAAPIMAAALCLTAAGCASLGPLPGTTAAAQASMVQGAGIAFESIDGPPPEIVHRFLKELREEATARGITALPAGSPAAYRVRGYLASRPQGAGASAGSITWVWDVYDGGFNRAFRLGGVEPASAPAHPDPKGWAGADDATLRRLAHAGIAQLADLIAAPGAVPALVAAR